MKFIYLKSNSIDEMLVHSLAMHFKKNYKGDVEINACKDSRELAALGLKQHPTDLIVTFNLAGFDICTLTDGLSYNLVDSKFIHFLLSDHLPNEKYLAKQLSISMFFYCVGESYCEYLLKNYPELPYLKSMDGWDNSKDCDEVRANNVSYMVGAIEEVMRECHLARLGRV